MMMVFMARLRLVHNIILGILMANMMFPNLPVPKSPPAVGRSGIGRVTSKVISGNSSKKYMMNKSKVPTLYPSLYSVLGDNLIVADIDSPVVQTHLKDISKIPIPALKGLKDYNVKIYIGDNSVAGFPGMEDMKDKTPFGWDSKYTYNDIAGTYDTSGKVYLGADQWNTPNLALHEMSHAIGAIMGVDSDSDLQKYYDRYKGKTNTYQADGGNYLEEFFAGVTTDILTGNDKAYDKDFINYIYKILNGYK